ncbi:succinate dehydrogenase, cytochrome b556 subunit [Candidatus Albibeggiatoa sp. nov. BB20]|uniref:succinate dehydrogenase, cytochrome b556 subunit n=1 Tax=Candidatus Albibeggiatoa sp. nov. BB20 TaxID=3162723 RepID=UPI0033658346
MATHKRPLSPHLGIYKPQLTSFMSILHRATGVFLAVGLLPLTYWLYSISLGPEAYEQVQSIVGSPIGLICLFGWSFALFYHLCNGIRHLLWDAGFGFDIKTAYTTGYIVWVAAFVLTASAWALAVMQGTL